MEHSSTHGQYLHLAIGTSESNLAKYLSIELYYYIMYMYMHSIGTCIDPHRKFTRKYIQPTSKTLKLRFQQYCTYTVLQDVKYMYSLHWSRPQASFSFCLHMCTIFALFGLTYAYYYIYHIRM